MVEPLPIDMKGETLRSIRLRGLVRYWNEKRRNRPMPARGDIDPIEIPRLLPVTLVADITAAGPYIRLLGSESTYAYGRELRGYHVEEVEFGAFTPFWRDAFAHVLASGASASATGTFQTPTESRSVELALMPLAGEDREIGHVFGGLVIRPLAHGVIRSNGTRVHISSLSGDLEPLRTGLRST